MNLPLNKSAIETLRSDLPASLVVFFVAIPLCLGISLASGAPLISGIIAGILGGVVAGILSGSQLSVAGPAAGLSSIVLTSIDSLGTFQAFSVAVVFAGVLQILFGLIRAGAIGYFFPSAVIKGMLAGIGVILILKQIPHAFGDDRDFEGDESFFQADNENTVTEIINSVVYHSTGALFISLTCLAFLIWWGSGKMKALKWTAWIPGPLVAVLLGIVINTLFTRYAPAIALDSRHLVDLPEISGIGSMVSLPDWSVIGNSRVYVIALTLALVASLETLLSIEA
ncbi:MAG: SulP family inorganic anion transporter, partial [Bacteroidota bacterium]